MSSKNEFAGNKTERTGDFRAALLYMLVSILLILFNKATFAYYDLGAPNILTLCQNICSFSALLICKRLGKLHFHDFNMHNFRRLLPVGLTFIAYMVFGMIAMKVVTIAMYTTLRRTTVVFVMFLEYFISRKVAPPAIQLSVVIMVLGALVAGAKDLDFNVLSYALVIVYNLFTALYLVLINRISAQEKTKDGVEQTSTCVSSSASAAATAGAGTHNHGSRRPSAVITPQQKLDQYDFMFYNNLISIPWLCLIIYTTGEASSLLSSPFLRSPGFLLAFLGSSLLAFVLNYAIFWNTAVNSALTQTVSGQAKDIFVVVAGYILFQSTTTAATAASSSASAPHSELGNFLGVVLGFVGSVAYAAAKLWPDSAQALIDRIGSILLPATIRRIIWHESGTSTKYQPVPLLPMHTHGKPGEEDDEAEPSDMLNTRRRTPSPLSNPAASTANSHDGSNLSTRAYLYPQSNGYASAHTNVRTLTPTTSTPNQAGQERAASISTVHSYSSNPSSMSPSYPHSPSSSSSASSSQAHLGATSISAPIPSTSTGLPRPLMAQGPAAFSYARSTG